MAKNERRRGGGNPKSQAVQTSNEIQRPKGGRELIKPNN